MEGKWKACKKLDVFSKMLVYSSCVSYMADFMLAFIFPFKPSKKILTLIFLHYVHKVFVFRSLMRSEEKSGCKIKKSESLQTEDRHFRSKICKLSDAVPQRRCPSSSAPEVLWSPPVPPVLPSSPSPPGSPGLPQSPLSQAEPS